MHANLAWFTVLIFAFITAQAAPAASSGEYILKLRSSQQLFSSAAVLESEGVHVVSHIHQLGMLVVDQKPLAGTLGDALVEYATPNGQRTLHDLGTGRAVTASPTGTHSKFNWDMEQINAVDAWTVTKGSRDVIAAISDTGLYDHFQLQPNFWINAGENGRDADGHKKWKNKRDDDGNGAIDDLNGWNARRRNGSVWGSHYHATHVSGTIGAYTKNGNEAVVGVNWQVSLMEVPFIDDTTGSGSDADGIKTILYAADNGAKVLNCSWGGAGQNPAMREAIEYAKSKGMLLVISAGNDGVNNDSGDGSYPASYDNENIIAVAATDASRHLTTWSNYGVQSVDLGAPGDNIVSTWNPNNSPLRRYWYYAISGTSMAAPHVTGAVALIYAANPTLNWRQVKDLILSTVTPRSDLRGKTLTGGELNVGAAVARAHAMLTE